MEPTLPPLIHALLDAHRYPDAPQKASQVELVQTHISWVLLVGEFAYKIKKPLKLSFLDFSTLPLRHAACLEELRLNRRFAPDIYLPWRPQTPALAGWTTSPHRPWTTFMRSLTCCRPLA